MAYFFTPDPNFPTVLSKFNYKPHLYLRYIRSIHSISLGLAYIVNMSRFPPIAPAQQTSEQKQAHVDLESITVFGRPLAGKDDEGALTGPFAAML